MSDFVPVEKECEFCGKKFLITTPHKINIKRFCCKKCSNKAMQKKYREEIFKGIKTKNPSLESLQWRNKIRSNSEDLDRVSVIAAASGMSYGEYTSRDYAPVCDFSKYNF